MLSSGGVLVGVNSETWMTLDINKAYILCTWTRVRSRLFQFKAEFGDEFDGCVSEDHKLK